jgi:hypothetical protein
MAPRPPVPPTTCLSSLTQAVPPPPAVAAPDKLNPNLDTFHCLVPSAPPWPPPPLSTSPLRTRRRRLDDAAHRGKHFRPEANQDGATNGPVHKLRTMGQFQIIFIPARHAHSGNSLAPVSLVLPFSTRAPPCGGAAPPGGLAAVPPAGVRPARRLAPPRRPSSRPTPRAGTSRRPAPCSTDCPRGRR